MWTSDEAKYSNQETEGQISFFHFKILSLLNGLRLESCVFQLDSEDFRDLAVVADVSGVLMIYISRDKSWAEIEGQMVTHDMVSF